MNMIPAVGWAAVYEIDNSTVAKPLVVWISLGSCLSITVDDGKGRQTDIVGMVVGDNGSVIRADSIDGFKTYEYDLDSANIDYLEVKNGN